MDGITINIVQIMWKGKTFLKMNSFLFFIFKINIPKVKLMLLSFKVYSIINVKTIQFSHRL
jgi:hypothetical protein